MRREIAMALMPKPEPAEAGQESVWDYPRPPRVEEFVGSITIELGDQPIAIAARAWRVLETSHPPTYYLPPASFAEDALRPATGSSWCEWKGHANYYDLVTPAKTAPRAAWSYANPSPAFRVIAGAVAVMAALVDRCTVNGEQVIPQPGGFYGGWITSRVVGPFKGVAGSEGW
ncbi:uncharacterized protein (DUF427 family) [Mycobacterium sp. OAE908]